MTAINFLGLRMVLPTFSDNRATVITNFTQSLGAELLVNGDFSAWTGDDPDGWTVSGEVGADPEMSEVGTGEAHGGVGTGSANFFSSATNFQPRIAQTILTSKSWYQIDIDVSLVTSGSLYNLTPGLTELAQITGDAGLFGFVTATAFTLTDWTAASDVTVDTVSVKKATLNAVHTFAANGTFDFEYTLPGSPTRGNQTILLFRIADIANGDFWMARVLRQNSGVDYNFYLDKVIAGVATNKFAVANVGITDAIRAVCAGNDITCYTRASGTWTQRGTTQTDAQWATATGITTAYYSSTTPTKLILNA